MRLINIISTSRLYRCRNINHLLLYNFRNGFSFRIHSWFYRNRVISFYQNEWELLARFLLTECSKVGRSLSSARRNMFLSNHVPAYTRPLESATGRTNYDGIAERRRKCKAGETTWRGEGERTEAKILYPLVEQ